MTNLTITLLFLLSLGTNARSQVDTLNGPEIFLIQEVYNFGQIDHGGNYSGEIIIKNIGTDLLYIYSINNVVGVKFLLDNMLIGPNDSITLRFTFDSHTFPGDFAKSTIINSNSTHSPQKVFTLTGEIIPNPDSRPDPNKAEINSTFYKLQYEYGNINSLHFSFGIYKFWEEIVLWEYFGAYSNIGIGLFDNKNIMINQFGCEYNYLIFTTRLGLINHTNFHNNQLCIRPEIGISMFSKISLTYGYNFNLQNSFEDSNFSGHYLTLNFGLLLPFKKYR